MKSGEHRTGNVRALVASSLAALCALAVGLVLLGTARWVLSPAAAAPAVATVGPAPAGLPAPTATVPPRPAEAVVAVPSPVLAATSAAPGAMATLAPTATAAANDVEQRVQAALDQLPAGSTAVFQDLSGATRVERDGAKQMVAASTIKLPIAIEALRQENAGLLPPGTSFTVRPADVVGGTGVLQGQVGRTLGLTQLIEVTLTCSDNVGANLLLAKVGLANVNRTMDGLGYHATRVQRTLMDTAAEQRGLENLTSADDLAGMLASAYRGQLVNPWVSQETLRILRLRGQQMDPTLDFMGRLLKPRPALAHINGELAGVRNDAGLVPLGSRAYVLAILTHQSGHDQQAEQAIAAASAAVFRAFS